MTTLIDLDAARREVQHPDGIAVLFRKRRFVFPAELPATALDTLLSEELDLAGFLGDIAITTSSSIAGEAIELLTKRPRFPAQLWKGFQDLYEALLGEEQYKEFIGCRPSFGDYVRLTKALAREYGVSLGKLFGLSGSSSTSGETSNPISSDSTGSTPEASGSNPGSQASSESAD
ncbi:hypothetical protein ACQEVS_09785 [Streptomyces sp. CA-181903]|uniref:hypothetical protein n=1 Tax=Streptomyces sp. CA-181903 TaxID=3240055 RepID=UPI003D9080DB